MAWAVTRATQARADAWAWASSAWIVASRRADDVSLWMARCGVRALTRSTELAILARQRMGRLRS